MGKLAKTLIAVLVLGIALYLGYRYMEGGYQKKLNDTLEKEHAERSAETSELHEKIADLEKELAKQTPTPVPEEKSVEVFGEPEPVPSPEREEVSCEALEERIEAFFRYLDKQAYMTAYEGEGGTYDLFKKMVAELSENPPMVTGEMKDLISLIRNVAHFYRVLGINRITIIKTILQNESEILESAMANFYAWFSACDRCEHAAAPCPSLEVMYEYAGFFLNTLAGRSYLLRRAAPIRILTSYYSILILDKANDHVMNPYGIDIRPYINASLYDIANQKGFVYRNQYIEKLLALDKKYKM
jgi:hypothetical protein